MASVPPSLGDSEIAACHWDGPTIARALVGIKALSRLAADVTGWEHDNATFERAFERLLKALRTDAGREVPPEARL